MRVKIVKIDLASGDTDIIERNKLNQFQVDKLWKKHMGDVIMSLTSNKGYEAENCPRYFYQTEVIKGTNTHVFFLCFDETYETYKTKS